ncbi:deoxyribonuclease I, partial [Candidatus Kaiserbacteria bacterium]|nr:deoxyribonuclease I [Candidatus Kaiserbacteria bacterium]
DPVPTTAGETTVIASKNGTKYHLPSCPGASQIKEANRLEFASIAQARAAGYEPAKNCPGLQ